MKMKACPVCKSKNNKLFVYGFNGHAKHIFNETKEFAYHQCIRCGSLFLVNKLINKSFYKKYYEEDYRTADSGFLFKAGMLVVSLANRRKTQLIVENIQKEKHISILDIGSGHGNFLAQLQPAKFDRYGVEISKDLVKESRSKGLSIYTGDFLNLDFGNKKFDCICLWHVIEHIPYPQKLLKKIHNLLNTNGIFIFSTPSTDSIGFTLGKENWFHLEAPRHVVLYNSKSLTYLAKLSSFVELRKMNNYFEFPTDLFYSIRKTPNRIQYYLFYPFYKFIDSETITCVWRKK